MEKAEGQGKAGPPQRERREASGQGGRRGPKMTSGVRALSEHLWWGGWRSVSGMHGANTSQDDNREGWDIPGHQIISCKEMMQGERENRTSGSFLISFPLQARGGDSCHSEAPSGAGTWGRALMSDWGPAQLLVTGRLQGDPAAVSCSDGMRAGDVPVVTHRAGAR